MNQITEREVARAVRSYAREYRENCWSEEEMAIVDKGFYEFIKLAIPEELRDRYEDLYVEEKLEDKTLDSNLI